MAEYYQMNYTPKTCSWDFISHPLVVSIGYIIAVNNGCKNVTDRPMRIHAELRIKSSVYPNNVYTHLGKTSIWGRTNVAKTAQ